MVGVLLLSEKHVSFLKERITYSYGDSFIELFSSPRGIFPFSLAQVWKLK